MSAGNGKANGANGSMTPEQRAARDRCIVKAVVEDREPVKHVAARFGVSRPTVDSIVRIAAGRRRETFNSSDGRDMRAQMRRRTEEEQLRMHLWLQQAGEDDPWPFNGGMDPTGGRSAVLETLPAWRGHARKEGATWPVSGYTLYKWTYWGE